MNFQHSLSDLDLSGKKNGIVTIEGFNFLRNLRSISLSKIVGTDLTANTFNDFGTDLKKVQITKSNIHGIRNGAFKHIREITHLDFSENSISAIDDNAFSEVSSQYLSS